MYVSPYIFLKNLSIKCWYVLIIFLNLNFRFSKLITSENSIIHNNIQFFTYLLLPVH